jgi:hypothetical protein
MRAISFASEMIRAYQAGRKTQARRIAKGLEMPPLLTGETLDEYTNRLTGADGTGRRPYKHRNRQCSIGWHGECSDPSGERCECPCHKSPYGKPGDQLAFLEGYQIAGASSVATIVYGHYLADDEEFNRTLTPQEFAKWKRRKWPFRATPGRFMYRPLVRYKPQILSVRVERVQEISYADLLAEGCPMDRVHDIIRPVFDEDGRCVQKGVFGPRAWFWKLWDSIHGPGAWERNDWVFVIEFPRYEGAQ